MFRWMKILGPVAVVMAVTLGAAPAIASNAESADTVVTSGWWDYGVNQNGWNITIVNDSSQKLTYEGFGQPLNNVSYANDSIAAHTTDEDTRGKKSVLGGPANMDMKYSTGGHVGAFDLWVKSELAIDGSINVTASCIDYPATGLTCTVLRKEATKAIVFRVSKA